MHAVIQHVHPDARDPQTDGEVLCEGEVLRAYEHDIGGAGDEYFAWTEPVPDRCADCGYVFSDLELIHVTRDLEKELSREFGHHLNARTRRAWLRAG